MIKKLFSLLLLITNGFCYCQSLDVTPNGLRDSSDNEKTFIVLKIDNMIAKQLYDNAIKYIHKNYKSPEDVIKGKVDGEYLKFNTFKSNFLYVNNSGANILTDAKYTTELNFKDGKVKYEIVSLEIYAQTGGYQVLFTGGVFEGYPIYNKKGKLLREETKKEIEMYFNSEINRIQGALIGKNSKDDW